LRLHLARRFPDAALQRDEVDLGDGELGTLRTDIPGSALNFGARAKNRFDNQVEIANVGVELFDQAV